MQKYILNIETATEVCSVALSNLEGEVIALQEIAECRQHTAQITLLIQACLTQAQANMSNLAAVAVSAGPGSFSSLRVGAATAKGLCYALNIPLIAIDTLKSLAFQNFLVLNDNNFIYTSLIDARRMEVYASLWKAEADGQFTNLEPCQPVCIHENTWSAYSQKNIILAVSGNGAAKCIGILPQNTKFFTQIVCSAKHLAPLSAVAWHQKKFEDVAYYSPDYGKNPNITTPKKIF